MTDITECRQHSNEPADLSIQTFADTNLLSVICFYATSYYYDNTEYSTNPKHDL